MRMPKVIVLLLFLSFCQAARAAGPMLIVRHTDGTGFAHSVGSVKRITFARDSLFLALADRTEAHGLAAIRKIEFLWDPQAAGVDDPNTAAGVIQIAHLFQNRPNPFVPETQIAFELPSVGQADLGIYRPDGRLVRRLVSEQRAAGRHIVTWDGRDDAGRKVVAGIYFYQLRAPGVQESRRMVVLP
jgi:hypothetical protein